MEIIDSTWMPNIARENIDMKNAPGGTSHLRCATDDGRMRISETTRIALARRIIDTHWMHNIA